LTIIQRLWHHERGNSSFDPQVGSYMGVSFARVRFLTTKVENSEGTASALAVLWFAEPWPAQNFRRERDPAGCCFAAKNSKNSQERNGT
jgi:hypothetical protein